MKNKNLNKKLVEKIMSAKHCTKHDAEAWLKSVLLNNAELSRISGGRAVEPPEVRGVIVASTDDLYKKLLEQTGSKGVKGDLG